MTEVQSKLKELTEIYEKQLALYEQVLAEADREERLINDGRIDNLLTLLKEKEDRLVLVSAEEEKVRALQRFLAGFFELNAFSLPRLIASAAPRYREQIVCLQAVVEKLVRVLEELEKSEKRHEKMLEVYACHLQKEIPALNRQKQALRAYTDQLKKSE